MPSPVAAPRQGKRNETDQTRKEAFESRFKNSNHRGSPRPFVSGNLEWYLILSIRDVMSLSGCRPSLPGHRSSGWPIDSYDDVFLPRSWGPENACRSADGCALLGDQVTSATR